MRQAVALFLLGLLALAVARSATAAQASVDRAQVRLNESFTYTLRLEGEPNAEPDVTSLEQDFDILQRSQSTRIQGSNGQYSQFTEWQIVLMPTRIGVFTLPGVTVGGQTANPIRVEVLAAGSEEAPGDIFIEVSAEPQHPFVQLE